MSDPSSPPPACRLRVLGAPALQTGAGEHAFSGERAHLLLALLGCRRDWVRRAELADLLYPGRSLESARSNLRKVLFLARRLPGVGVIEQRGDLLRWAPASDLADFDAACDDRRWADALALYGGPLLLGLDDAWPPLAADWLQGQRQRLQARWHQACTRRLAELADRPEAACALAETLLRDDPLDDIALQALGRAQLALGHADHALHAVAEYRNRLANELGLAPSAALQALDAELRSGRPTATPALVGRRHERQQVHERLQRPDCRLLTLLGPPGVGKSTLARSVGAELGGHWVPLEDLTQPAQVPGRVAAALALTLDGAAPGWKQLAAALADAAPLLMVLDNAEALPMAGELGALLEAVPQLRVLATSRAPLGVAGEWRLPLDGLPLPDSDETDPEVLQANDAVRLFVERARPLAPGFDLRSEAGDMVRLVHEVAGLPLAIELLAAWRRLMPVREIVAELGRSLEVLEPSQPNERSVRASFARTWQQLGAIEQRVLAQLALLPAPMDREMVRDVLQAPLPVLAALADRSLLQCDDDGCFVLHPLIRRCAAPLAADADTVAERHARHVAQATPAQQAAVHLRAAWQWALRRVDAELLLKVGRPFAFELQRSAAAREGAAELQRACDALQPLVPASGPLPAGGAARRAAEALGMLRGFLALFRYQLGELPDSLAAATSALHLAQRLGDSALRRVAWTRIGAAHWQRGDHLAARDAFVQQRAALDAHDLGGPLHADAESWLALAAKSLGDFDGALRGYREAAAVLRAHGGLQRHLYLLNNLGNLLRTMGREAEALPVLHEGLQLAQDHHSLEDEPFLLTNIALVREQLREGGSALQWAERAVASAARHGEPMIHVAALVCRARLRAALGLGQAAAMADVHAAFTVAARLQALGPRLDCVAAAGVVLVRCSRFPEGLALVGWSMAQPQATRSDREDLERHLQGLAVDDAQRAQARLALAPDAPYADVLALLEQAARP